MTPCTPAPTTNHHQPPHYCHLQVCWSVFQGTLTSLVRECEALHASTNTLLADLLGVDPDSLQPQPHDEDDVCDEGAGLLLPPEQQQAMGGAGGAQLQPASRGAAGKQVQIGVLGAAEGEAVAPQCMHMPTEGASFWQASDYEVGVQANP